MQLTFSERLQRIQVAADLLEYAQLMEEMSINPKILIKNIFRKKEQQYVESKFSEKMFKQLRQHHHYNAVVTAFSYMKDEYIDKLKLKNGQTGISETAIKSIFVNPDDIEMYINHNPGQGNRLQDTEIIKLIRNALNHVENGILYKYIEDEDAIEINLRDLGASYNGKVKTFHVKVPISLLMDIIEKVDANGYTKSKIVYFMKNPDLQSPNLKENLKNDLKVIRIIPSKEVDYKDIFNEMVSVEDAADLFKNLADDNKIKTREYNYKNGGITDIEINSIYEILSGYKEDWRISCIYDNIRYLNALKLRESLPADAREKIARTISIRHSAPLGIVSFDRYIASILFNEYCLKSWNVSFDKVLEKQVRGVKDLKYLTSFEWFMIDPVEKQLAEYENFIRYSFINFAPIRPNNKPNYVTFEGKEYNCTFLRNAFAHGRIGYVKQGDNYLFALYDTASGLNNETNFESVEESFKPQLFTPKELVLLSQYFCMEEKKKIDGNIQSVKEVRRQILSNTFNNSYHLPIISRKY